MPRYEEPKFLFPPRPDNAIPPAMLDARDREDKYTAQIKKNGTCAFIVIGPDKSIYAWNRHNETHKLWNPETSKSRDGFSHLPEGWFAFAAEVLNSKVSGGPKDKVYLFDILVDNGEYLVGETFVDRQKRMFDLFDDYKSDEYSHYVFTDNLWVARPIYTGFRETFESLSAAEDEGLVLKRRDWKLRYCTQKGNSGSGQQLKCRRPHTNYAF